MPKSAVAGSARRRYGRRLRAELLSALEGQIAEMCRDLAVQAKGLRQLQQQADELRTGLRQWVGHSGVDVPRTS